MSSLEQLMRELNRTLRALNGIAVGLVSAPLEDRASAFREISAALEHLDQLQRLIVSGDPGLEYHYDPARSPTRYMQAVIDLVDDAEANAKQGNAAAAQGMLRRALEMEPPPLVYEAISKQLESLETRDGMQSNKTCR